jgi:methyl-accepting chemotaxis protein
MRFTLKTKLIAAFAAVLVLLGVVSWVSITRLAESNASMSRLVDNEAEQVRLANELQQSFLMLSDRINAHIIASTPEEMAALET